MPQSRGVRGRWMDRPGGKSAAHRRLAAGLLHQKWSTALRRSGGHRHDGEGAEAPGGVLAPLQVPKMPVAAPPPRDSRFGSPLQLSKGHWGRPEIVGEGTSLTWSECNM